MGACCGGESAAGDKLGHSNSGLSGGSGSASASTAKSAAGAGGPGRPDDIKLLMLGAGESGKSTFFKQIKILFDDGYSPQELGRLKDVIFTNVILNMYMLLGALKVFKFSYANPDNAARAERILLLGENEQVCIDQPELFTAEVARDIEELWRDDAIQRAYQRRNEFQLYDSAAYFFQHIRRLAAPDYRPTTEDVLRVRVKTTGIVEAAVQYDKLHLKLYDVGGQRPERRKWIKCFSGVTALLFFVAVSEYDQTCYEDNITNRMEESLRLFDEHVNGQWFSDTPVILFLNKQDLFREKIKHSDLTRYFPDYRATAPAGSTEFLDSAVKFVAEKFRRLNRNPDRVIYTYPMCATDTDNMKQVMEFVKDILLETQRRNPGGH